MKACRDLDFVNVAYKRRRFFEYDRQQHETVVMMNLKDVTINKCDRSKLHNFELPSHIFLINGNCQISPFNFADGQKG